MTSRWVRLERLYHDAAALPELDRRAFLDAACDDAAMRHEVEAMLSHDGTMFLENPAAALSTGGSLTGARLGVYDVGEVIGRGGMGEVYRARDTTLGREVAIKVLPPEWLADPHRRTRFEREARILASLNHQNIANIFELDSSAGMSALVMELVEGETLRDRIAAGPVPIVEAIALGVQMADGLEAAHEAGVVHRDFKPDNVKITPAGTIKILDFGIAAVESARSAAVVATGPTRPGDVLGTAAYMSPEQARGKQVDRRTDIWAFACVMYELMTGRRAFSGDTWSDVAVSILEREPDWTVLAALAPAPVVRLIQRSLVKDPRQRLRDIGDMRLELQSAASPPAAGSRTRSGPSRSTRWLAWAAVPLAIALALVVGTPRRHNAERTTNLAVPLPRGVGHSASGAEIALAPDGRSVAFVGLDAGGHSQLYLQSFDAVNERALKNTGGARFPFFSPDGKWIAFYSDRRLKKLALPDGPVQSLCGSDGVTRDPDWSDDGTILYGEESDVPTGILRISSDCGPAEVLTRPNSGDGEVGHFAPQRIAGTPAILFTTRRNTQSGVNHRVMVLAAPGQAPRVLIDDAIRARYAGDGAVLFQRGASVFEARLDTAAWTVGPPHLVVDNVDTASIAWRVARDVVVYQPNVEETRTFSWIARDGTEEIVHAPPRRYYAPHLSPRGDMLAVEIQSDAGVDVWIYDIARDTLRRVTFDGRSRYPEWTPDGSRITISKRRDATLDTYWLPAEGGTAPELLKRNDQSAFVVSWTRDLRTLIYSQSTHNGSDLWAFDREDGRAYPLLESAATKYAARLSPDQRWLAYVSNATGRFELYVTSYPGLSRQWQLTTGGAREPLWSADGREVFYRSGEDVLSIPIESTSPFVVGRPRVLFGGPYFQAPGPGIRSFNVSPDGQRFLMLRTPAVAPTMLRVIQGFRSTLGSR